MYNDVNEHEPTKYYNDNELIEKFKTALEELGENRNFNWRYIYIINRRKKRIS